MQRIPRLPRGLIILGRLSRSRLHRVLLVTRRLVVVLVANVVVDSVVVMADLVDVVTIANLQSRTGTEHPHGTVNWLELPAARRLGFAEELQEIELEAMEEVVDEVKSLFE